MALPTIKTGINSIVSLPKINPSPVESFRLTKPAVSSPSIKSPVAPGQTAAATSLPAINAPKPPAPVLPPTPAPGTPGGTIQTQKTSGIPSGWDAQTYANFKAANPTLEPDAQDTAMMFGSSSPNVPDPQAAYKAAQDAYLATLGVSPGITSATKALGDVASRTAADEAAAQAAYDARFKAINEQATLQPFLTGRQTQASNELANLMAAIQAKSGAETLPLQQRLATEQANRQAQQEQANAKVGFLAPKAPVEVSAGNTLVDPTTGQPIYSAPAKLPTGQPTASIQEYEYAKAKGYTGSFTDYQNEDANRKAQAARASDDPNRTLSATEAQALGVPFGTTASQAFGISPTKPMTEAQAKDLTYATRASEAESYLKPLEATIASMNPASFAAQVAVEPNAIGNAFVSDNIRRLRQAERNFETAVLRRESGAAISASEFATDEKKYFPRPGDDAATLRQKAEARQSAIDSMKASLSSGQSSSGKTGGDAAFSW